MISHRVDHRYRKVLRGTRVKPLIFNLMNLSDLVAVEAVYGELVSGAIFPVSFAKTGNIIQN
jgi:hypothetical protein